jgi:hypothetical protein
MNVKPEVTLSEAFARSLTHPEYAPHGVELVAEYRVPRKSEIYAGSFGLESTHDDLFACLWLVVTPRKPSLAQMVKESGWRSPVGRVSLSWVHHKERWLLGEHWLLSHACPTVVTPKDKSFTFEIDNQGYPIVEGGAK